MNIEFIKWLVGYAEGFDLLNDGDDIFPEWVLYYNGYSVDPITGDFNRTIQYEHLLTRSIEGINREKLPIEISCYSTDIQIFNRETIGTTYFMLNEFEKIDQAKEQALKYIWEQEKG